jgi:microcin C transport system substrate-binding protein
MRSRFISLCLTALAASPLHADDLFPKPDWQEKPNPIASPDAVPGGSISVFGFQYPKSFNLYLDNNTFTSDLFSSLYESLLTMNPLTPRQEPGLAERWAISDDKRTFTFWLNPKARWSDGRPITAHDVKWTFDAIRNPANLTGAHKSVFESFESITVVDDHCVRFAVKEVHWRNLLTAGGFAILPKHAFEKLDFNKINFEFPVVSGPYQLGEIKEGISATLKRRADWWNRQAPSQRGLCNFQSIKFKFFASPETGFEAFMKGDIDLFAVYSARLWMNETSTEKFARNWIVRQKVFNYEPTGFQGFAMNLRRPPFNDKRVRQAMALLLNRERMNSALMYDQYALSRSYYTDLYDTAHPCPNGPFTFNKERARRLLAEAGWKANPKTGLLEKDGKRFEFRFLERESVADKFLAIYAEDLRDVGILMQTDSKDGSAWTRDMDEFNFDMTWGAFSSGLYKDPEMLWASKEADRKMSANITGFKNATVDELIEKQKSMFDVAARHALCRQIDGILYEECPYVLLWGINYKRLVYWNKFGTPATVLDKYSGESSAYWLWWYDADAAADLKDAIKNNLPLPPRPAEVTFKE